MSDGESTPLINALPKPGTSVRNPVAQNVPSKDETSQSIKINKSVPDDFHPNLSSTPSYDDVSLASASSLHPTSVSDEAPLVCKVCNERIDITGKRHQQVVKCMSCKESTPIRGAPYGYKYVRCPAPCNCLLICREDSQKIACPRVDCKRVISLALPRRPTLVPQTIPGVCRIACGHCHEGFQWNIETSSLATCSHCKKLSSVGDNFKQVKSRKYILLGFIMLVISIGVTASTATGVEIKAGYFVLYTLLFGLAIVLLGRGLYFCTMKVSHADLLA